MVASVEQYHFGERDRRSQEHGVHAREVALDTDVSAVGAIAHEKRDCGGKHVTFVEQARPEFPLIDGVEVARLDAVLDVRAHPDLRSMMYSYHTACDEGGWGN